VAWCRECGQKKGHMVDCPDNPDNRGGLRCSECSGLIDSSKRNWGHHKNCPVVKRNENPARTSGRPPRPGVKVPAHDGPYKAGRKYRNDVGLKVQDWTCQTCKTVRTTLEGQRPSPCPEKR